MASSTRGSTKASGGTGIEAAGTAATAIQVEGTRRPEASRSVNTEPIKKNDPASGLISMVFLPIHPRPARCASSRSGTGPASAKVRLSLAPAGPKKPCQLDPVAAR